MGASARDYSLFTEEEVVLKHLLALSDPVSQTLARAVCTFNAVALPPVPFLRPQADRHSHVLAQVLHECKGATHMQRKSVLYVLTIFALLVAMVPLGVAAQGSGPPPPAAEAAHPTPYRQSSTPRRPTQRGL